VCCYRGLCCTNKEKNDFTIDADGFEYYITFFLSAFFINRKRRRKKKRKEILPYHKNQPFGFPYQIALIE
jgi:hypothetical protein